MIFESIHKARKWFLNYQPFDDNIEVPFFSYDYDWQKWKMGDWALVQHLDSNSKESVISRPMLIMFIGTTFWDMALVVNYVDGNRAWRFSHSTQTTGTDGSKYDWVIGHADYEIQQQPLWHDNLLVIDHWENKPNWKQLKQSLKNITYKGVPDRHNLSKVTT